MWIVDEFARWVSVVRFVLRPPPSNWVISTLLSNNICAFEDVLKDEKTGQRIEDFKVILTLDYNTSFSASGNYYGPFASMVDLAELSPGWRNSPIHELGDEALRLFDPPIESLTMMQRLVAVCRRAKVQKQVPEMQGRISG